MHRTLLLLALSAASALSATTPAPAGGERKSAEMAFANSFSPSLRFTPSSAASSFSGDRVVAAAATLDEATASVQGLSMSCRRNLKKEKRHRNEVMARQFRKPTFGRFRGRGGRGGGRAAQAAQTEADSEWLDQIYGQHTIYRRDEGAASSAGDAQEESEGAKVQEKELVTA